MKVIDAVKTTAFTTAINSGLKYLEKDPEVNIPKLMSLVDKAAPEGWYESARDMIRKAIKEKGNWYDLIMKIYQLSVTFQKIDCSPDSKTCSESDNKCLKYRNCAVEKCHIIFPPVF